MHRMISASRPSCVRDCSCAPAADGSYDDCVLRASGAALSATGARECGQESESSSSLYPNWSTVTKQFLTAVGLQQTGGPGMIDVMIKVPLEVGWEGGMGGECQRSTPGGIRASWLSAGLHSCGLAVRRLEYCFLLVEMCRLGAFSTSLSFSHPPSLFALYW